MKRRCVNGEISGSYDPGNPRADRYGYIHCGADFDDYDQSTICPHDPINPTWAATHWWGELFIVQVCHFAAVETMLAEIRETGTLPAWAFPDPLTADETTHTVRNGAGQVVAELPAPPFTATTPEPVSLHEQDRVNRNLGAWSPPVP